jgi:hypothetical protein
VLPVPVLDVAVGTVYASILSVVNSLVLVDDVFSPA